MSTTFFFDAIKRRLVPLFVPDGLDPVVDEPRHDQDYYAGDGEVEGPHDPAQVLPVLSQLEPTVGQTQAPWLGPDERVEAEFPEVHPGDTGLNTDEGTDHRKHP